MTIENQSEFLKIQKTACEVVEPKEKEKDKVCPTCIPDPNALVPEWWSMDRPFLNKKTCEYSIAVTINEEGKSYAMEELSSVIQVSARYGEFLERGDTNLRKQKFINFEDLKRSYVKPGIRMMLAYYDKLITDDIVCANPPRQLGRECETLFNPYTDTAKNLDALEVYAQVPQFRFTATNSKGLLQILVTVPATVFNKVPDAPELPEVDTSVKKLQMKGKDMRLAFIETHSALKTFATYQSYFYQEENGNLYFEESQKLFFLSSIAARMNKFFSNLKELLDLNGFRFEGDFGFEPKAHEVIITFNKDDPENPFIIKHIKAKQKGCRWKKLKKGFDRLFAYTSEEVLDISGKVTDQTTLGYVAKLDKMHGVLTARQTPAWLDFVLEYTYPPLTIDFGSSIKFKDKRPDFCLSDMNAISNAILGSTLTFSKAFAYQLSNANCMSMYGKNYVFKKTPADFSEKDIDLNLNIPNFGFDADKFKESTFKGRVEYMKSYVQGKFSDGLEAITEESPVLQSLIKFGEKFSDNSSWREHLADLASLFNPCSFNKVTLTILKCLFRGMDADKAYKTLIKTTLGNLASEGLEIVIAALPADKQAEIRKVVEAEFGNMPAPWEEGYSSGSLEEARKKNATNKMPADSEEKLSELERFTGYQSNLNNNVSNMIDKLAYYGYSGPEIKISVEKIDDKDKIKTERIQINLDEEAINQTIKNINEGQMEESIKESKFVKDYLVESLQGTITNAENDERTLDGFNVRIRDLDRAASDYYALLRRLKNLDASVLILADPNALVEPDNLAEEEALKRQIIKIPEFGFSDFSDVERYDAENRLEELYDQVTEESDELEDALHVFIESISASYNLQSSAIKDAVSNNQISGFLNRQTPNKIEDLTDRRIAEAKKEIIKSLNMVQDLRSFSIGMEKTTEETKQYAYWDSLPPAQKEKLIEEQIDKSFFVKLNPEDSYEVGTLGKATGNVQKAITKAYVDAIIETAEIQQIMRAFDNLPGIKIFASMLRTFKCPKTHFIYPPIDSFLKTLSFDPCNLKGAGLALPSIAQIPNISWDIVKNIVDAFIKALKITMTQALAALIAKMAKMLSAALCNFLGNPTQNPFQVKSLMDILGREECKPSDILKAAAKAPPGKPPTDEDFEQLAKTVSAAGPVLDLQNALMGNPSPEYLRNVGQAVARSAPAFAPSMSDPESLKEFFAFAGAQMTPEQRKNVQSNLDPSPIFNSPVNKCLTNVEAQQRNNFLNEALSSLPDDIKEQYIQQEEDNLEDNTSQIIQMALNGPMETLHKILDDALDPEEPDCVDNVNSVGAVIKKAKEATSFKSVKEGIFMRVQKAFLDDMIDWNMWEPLDSPGILGQILCDTKGYTLNRYNWYRNLKNSAGWFTGLFPEASPLPKTIAVNLREQIVEQTLESKLTWSGDFDKENVTLEYKTDDFINEIKYFEYANRDDLSYKVQTYDFEKGVRKILEFTEPMSEQVTQLVGELGEIKNSKDPYKIRLLAAFLDNLLEPYDLGLKTNRLSRVLIDNFNHSMFKKLPTRILSDRVDASSHSDGFKYGYDPVELTKEDLTYVNPEPGSTEYTYTEDSKVLGRSLTNNPRVQFLDPAQHGGTYTSPFYNILSEKKEGWSQFAKGIISNIEGCEDVDSNFMFFRDIMDRISDQEGKIKKDDRLSLAPDCVIEKAFDKIGSPTTLATLEGIITATIRIYVIDYMIRTFSINANLNLNFEKNHTKIISKFLTQEILRGLSEQDTLFIPSTYTKGTYALLFLEQVVQSMRRKLDNEEIESTEEIEQLMSEINTAQRLQVIPTYQDIFGDFKNDVLVDKVSIGALLAALGTITAPTLVGLSLAGVTLSTAFTLNQLRFVSKLETIYSVKDQCVTLLEYLVEEQINFYAEVLFEYIEPRPYIHDISKFFIGASRSTMFEQIRAGEVEVELPTGGKSNYPYGSIQNCVRNNYLENPLENINFTDSEINDINENGGFYLEKYLRIEDKITTSDIGIQTNKIGDTQYQTDFIKDRIDNLKGVVNIEEFKQFLSDNSDKIPASADVSELFGNAKYNMIDNTYSGSIGIKFGVRLCYMPSKLDYNQPPLSELSVASDQPTSGPLSTMEVQESQKVFIREKSFFFKRDERFPTSTIIIPLCSYEMDVLDKKLVSYIDSDENFNQELKCYVDGLARTPEFDFIFNNILNIKKVPSLMSLYSYNNFFHSLGKGANEREGTPDKELDFGFFGLYNDTKDELRKLFVSYYKRKDFDPEDEESQNEGFIEDLTREFLAKTLNGIFIGADVPWWMKFNYKPKKVDKNGDPCPNQFSGLVSAAGE